MIDTARLLYIAMVLIGYQEQVAWKKTPYQILTLFRYHKEYNPHIFQKENINSMVQKEAMDDIDLALEGL